jgi:nitroreductase/dihydropteridine reductase
MEFKEVVMKRYATKKFDGKKVPEEKIGELIELIRFAPSAVNLQPWKIKVITDQKVKEQLRPLAFNQEQITSCSHLLVLCADTDTERLIGKLDQTLKAGKTPDEFRNMVVGLAKGMTGSMTPEAKLEWAKCQVFLALGNAVNGAKSLGLDSCPMTGFDPKAFFRVLGIPANLVPTALCAVGYAADAPMPKLRFPKEDILF